MNLQSNGSRRQCQFGKGDRVLLMVLSLSSVGGDLESPSGPRTSSVPVPVISRKPYYHCYQQNNHFS